METSGHHGDRGSLAAFRRYRSTRDRSLRNTIIEAHQGFAYHLARQYTGRGIDDADLRQVAIIGLVKAVERFDPDRGVSFATFARPFIVGELRHTFRDSGWEVSVPRSVKEAAQRVRASVEALRAETRAEPSVRDIADDAGLTVDEVLTAMDAVRVTRTKRFEAVSEPSTSERMQPRHLETGYSEVETRELLEDVIGELDERDQRIVHARFVLERTQSEIAEEVGVSQVHVSRMLRRILAQLRQRLEDGDGPAGRA